MQTGYVLMAQGEGDPARILIVGGSTHANFDFNTQSDAPAVRGAFIFEYNHHSPQLSFWRTTAGPPTVARLLTDTVLLADGSVFVVNGISLGAAAGHSSGIVFQADLFDPVSETFTPMADPDMNHPRGYHATAILLPDARVAVAGNTKAYNNPDPQGPDPFDDRSIQVYNPPYLFNGPRPVVWGVPNVVGYGDTIEVNSRGDPSIARVMMMRPCAVTHSQDMDQRAIWLKGAPGSSANTFALTIPTDRTLVPPGYYMLFFLSDEGVPSVASFVEITGRAGSTTGTQYQTLYLGVIENSQDVTSINDGDIVVDKIDQHCNVSLESRYGSVRILQKCDQHCVVSLKAKKAVGIGEKIDQHCDVTIVAEDMVTIGQKIDGSSSANITSDLGSIFIGQKIDGGSNVTLVAPSGTIVIQQKVDGNSNVMWKAMSFTCPDVGGGHVTEFF